MVLFSSSLIDEKECCSYRYHDDCDIDLFLWAGLSEFMCLRP